ncbi:hypothetical protein J6590_066971 [Homalodisca vitripennis]|nr:hypothetical protein J6590_066971 [Homalodisca vitripennis]
MCELPPEPPTSSASGYKSRPEREAGHSVADGARNDLATDQGMRLKRFAQQQTSQMMKPLVCTITFYTGQGPRDTSKTKVTDKAAIVR